MIRNINRIHDRRTLPMLLANWYQEDTKKERIKRIEKIKELRKAGKYSPSNQVPR